MALEKLDMGGDYLCYLTVENGQPCFVLFCLNGPQILDPVVGRPLVGFSLKPKGLACL